MCIYIYINVCEHVRVCVSVCAEENKGKREEGASLFSAVLSAQGSSFKVRSCHNKQTMSKNCNSEGKSHISRHVTTAGNDYKIEQFTGNA